VDLVEDATVVRSGIGSLIFWALLSLSAVVVNSWGQTSPSAVSSGAPAMSAGQFPAQAYGRPSPVILPPPAALAPPPKGPGTFGVNILPPLGAPPAPRHIQPVPPMVPGKH
jgi:hypothetical protein